MVMAITRELFVRSFTDLHDDRTALARELADKVHWHAHRICVGLVQVPHHPRKKLDQVMLLQKYLAVVGAKLIRNLPRIFQLVVLLEVAVPDRECVNRTGHQLGHQRHVE